MRITLKLIRQYDIHLYPLNTSQERKIIKKIAVPLGSYGASIGHSYTDHLVDNYILNLHLI